MTLERFNLSRLLGMGLLVLGEELFPFFTRGAAAGAQCGGEVFGRFLGDVERLVFGPAVGGFCAGSALVGPRYLESFAEDRFVPTIFAYRPPKLGSPVWSVVLLSVLVMLFLMLGHCRGICCY